MCGIVGWSARLDRLPDAAALAAMSREIVHRGPDGEGLWLDGSRGLALAHRRLSIIDLTEAAAQPMRDERGAVLAFNGEIYNFRALRTELEALGHRFRSSGDAEVVLHALGEWGVSALGRFAGMFAIAYVPADSSRVLLARDPLGIKPLLYARAEQGGAVLFASELRALLASGHIRRQVCEHALRQYLEFGYVLDGRHTMITGVEKVGAGEYLIVGQGQVVEREFFYRLPADPVSPPDATTDGALEATLVEVVGQHLVADVPVGVLLSGGLDSSVIAALAARHTRVRTVSFGFGRSAVDERPWARKVANAIGSDHTEIVIEPQDAIDQLIGDSDVFDDLIADGAVLSNRLAYRESRRLGLKVVLVGEGADELFGGYGIFAAAAQVRGPGWARRFQLYRRYAGRRYGLLFSEFDRRFRIALRDAHGDWVAAVRRFELSHQLPNQFVVKVDRASMSESIEARTPFLDRRVVAAAMAFDAESLGVRDEAKRPLRRLASRLGVLPAEVVSRPKFGIALASEWIERDPALRSLAADELLARGSWADRLRLRRPVRSFLERGRASLPIPSPLGVLSHVVWRLLLLSLWSKRMAVA